MKTFNLPDLGEGLAESEIVKWHVNVGDMVKLDQVILTVETAKATVDVPAPYSGRVVSRHGEEGDIVNIGALLLEIDETGAERGATVEKKRLLTPRPLSAMFLIKRITLTSMTSGLEAITTRLRVI